MDIISFQEAKKANNRIGNPNILKTDHKILVNAINELYDTDQLTLYEDIISLVAQNETKEQWFSFIKSGYITGIKCTGESHTTDFKLTLLTKPLSSGGKYIYYSGTVNNILWDIMRIPFYDEAGTKEIYVAIENLGPLTTFNLQIFVKKG
jgi:hypothetical protein